jgi:hypothetical protein
LSEKKRNNQRCIQCNGPLINDYCYRCMTKKMPTPEEIRLECLRIQDSWDEETELRRRCIPAPELTIHVIPQPIKRWIPCN